MYKVVKRTYRGLESAMVSNPIVNNGAYSLTYQIDEWTWPNFGKIMAFDKLEDASQFCRDNFLIYPDYCVFACQTLNPKPGKRIASLTKYADLKSFWEDESIYTDCFSAPYGTYFCDAIKLMEKV